MGRSQVISLSRRGKPAGQGEELQHATTGDEGQQPLNAHPRVTPVNDITPRKSHRLLADTSVLKTYSGVYYPISPYPSTSLTGDKRTHRQAEKSNRQTQTPRPT